LNILTDSWVNKELYIRQIVPQDFPARNPIHLTAAVNAGDAEAPDVFGAALSEH